MFATLFAASSDTVLRTVVGTFGTVLCAGVCLLGATAPAEAATAPTARVVSYSDLNLASQRGQKALDARIKQAARAVCDTGSDELRARNEEARCIRAAIAGAQTKIAYQG